MRDLRRVNLLVGRNNVGKTSVLEALLLSRAPTQPWLALQTHRMRGLDGFHATPEGLWSWLFHQMNTQRHIELRTHDEQGKESQLHISLGGPPSQAIDVTSTTLSTADHLNALMFSYRGPDSQEELKTYFTLRPGADPVQVVERDVPLSVTRFLSTRKRDSQEYARFFSILRRQKSDALLLNLLQEVDTRVRGLEVLTVGEHALLHADLDTGELLPLQLMGEGANHLVGFASAVLMSPKGTVLIDEVDNGLHYSALETMWRGLRDSTRQANVQLFATSHSYGCIQAAARVFSNHLDDFSLLRLQRRPDGTLGVVPYVGEAFRVYAGLNKK
ncbi:MAG: AAA family ATPase [Polyangiales bacterium]